MPIYEFKCLKCNEFFEIIITSTSQDVEMACPKCQSEDFERVLSTTSYTMGNNGGKPAGVKTESRQCSSGSCTTYELPGLTK